MKVEIEGGTVLEFPDDTPPQVIQDTVKRLIQQQSGQIGEAVPPAQAADEPPHEDLRPKDAGLFPSLDPLSKLKLTGADWVNRKLTEVGSYGDTGPLPGRTAPTPPPGSEIPLIPRHAQDVVEFAGLGRAARGIQGFVGGVRQGLKTGPGTTLEAKPPVGTSQTPIVEPGASQAPKTGTSGAGLNYDNLALLNELKEGRLTPQSHEAILELAKQEFISGRVQLNLERPLFENVAEAIEKGQMLQGDPALTKELASFYRQIGSEWGKNEQKLSALAKDLKLEGVIPSALPDSAFARVWKRSTNVYKGLLVSQLATAVRNFETQQARLGLDVLQSGLDTSLQQILKLPPTSRDLDGLMQLVQVFTPGTKRTVDEVLRAFPAQETRMLGTYSSDVMTKLGIERGIPEKLTDIANTVNRFQEFLTRRGVFQATLEQRLRSKGRTLDQLLAENRAGSIDIEDIKYAVDAALEKTFAAQPEYGSLAYKFVQVVNAPGSPLQPIIWFPRFMVNSVKFQFEYSPVGVLRYLSARERSALAHGDTKGLSRAIIGAAMFDAAVQFRNSELAGERWYEAKLPYDIKGVGKKGDTVDMRPFNPFAAYLFAADVTKRQKDGTLRHMDGGDITKGVLSVNMKAGIGGFMLDAVFRNFGGDPQAVYDNLMQAAGEGVAGALNPLRQFVDIYDDFTGNPQVQRDIADQPFLGPMKKAIPGAHDDLPAYVSPTRRGPTISREPAARQFTGARITAEKNPAEKEFDRLGFEGQEIFERVGDTKIDRIRAGFSGALVEDIIVPFVQSPSYTGITDNHIKAFVLSKQMARVHDAVSQLTDAALSPEDHMVRAIQKLPKDLRRYLQKRNITPSAIREKRP